MNYEWERTFIRPRMRYEGGKKGKGWYQDGYIAYRPWYQSHYHYKTRSTYDLVETVFPIQWQRRWKKLLAFLKLGKWPIYHRERHVESYLAVTDGMGYGATKKEAYQNLKAKCMIPCI